MGPATTERPAHVYQRPEWMDDEVIAELPEEKQAYWKNRVKGKNGQGVVKPKPKLLKESDVEIGFDNLGNMYAKSRAVRRQRPFTENKYTKKSPKRKKK